MISRSAHLVPGIDATTPGGRLFFHMLAAIAEFEHDLRGCRAFPNDYDCDVSLLLCPVRALPSSASISSVCSPSLGGVLNTDVSMLL
jgi:hypothetical protein